ncbi:MULTISPECIES: hypothetical protein [unclassified Crossiella]|uniref:hypothetical protein n=1 Tax=unclassified Crossiella TaxID=2620835 RepID=UPI001FFF6FF6|nr:MULTISPECIES: hypothetical protein [unclassified Crossiella]MCK2237728.1 hypothetical protein [Crossiella sp. S99.2]MCK2255014.1 hypothetical protein [Crossiella sp. S99.1]
MLATLVTQITDHVAAAPPDLAETTSAITALLVAEPRNRDDVAAVVEAILDDALGDPFRETTANRWRALVPRWVHRPMLGATVRRMVELELLVPTGRYVHCTDASARNTNKLQPIYALDLIALREHQADEAVTDAAC